MTVMPLPTSALAKVTVPRAVTTSEPMMPARVIVAPGSDVVPSYVLLAATSVAVNDLGVMVNGNGLLLLPT